MTSPSDQFDDNDGENRVRLLSGLDRIESVASTLYLAIVALVVIGAVAALLYLVTHVPRGFGNQGEWLYVGLGFLLVIGWALAQIASILRRRRRAITDHGGFRFPNIDVRINHPGALDVQGDRLKWSASTVKTIKIEQTQVDTAARLAQQGLEWDEISRRVNPDYDGLDVLERNLYRQALRMSVEAKARA